MIGLTMYLVSQPLALVLVACGENVSAPAATLLMPELPVIHSTVLVPRLASSVPQKKTSISTLASASLLWYLKGTKAPHQVRHGSLRYHSLNVL